MAEVIGQQPQHYGNVILTLREVSERTRVPLATLQWWRAREPHRGPKLFKLGARIVAKESDVDAWIEAQYVADTSGVPAA